MTSELKESLLLTASSSSVANVLRNLCNNLFDKTRKMIILLMPPEKFKSNLCTDYYYAYVYKNEYTILAPSSKLDEAMTKVADPIYGTR